MTLKVRYQLAALLGAAIVMGLLVPAQVWSSLPDLCLFHRCTGLPCPTCGMTRSWAALLHGEVGAAFRFHWLGPALLVGLAGLAVAQLFRRAQWPFLSRGWAWGLGSVWAAYGLLRMAGWL